MIIRDNQLKHEILLNGGITFNVKVNKKIDKKDGYMVAIRGCEKIIKVEDLNNRVISNYIDKCLDILLQNEYYFGAWVDDGKVYLDVSKYSENLKDALWLGMFEHQLAIYDIKNETSITID